MKTRTKSLVVTVVVGGVMAIASFAWACTVLVGSTYITGTDQTPSESNADLVGDSSDDTPGVPGATRDSDVSAKGSAAQARQPSACNGGGEGSDCDYELVSASSAAAFSCHFNDDKDDDPDDAGEAAKESTDTTQSNTGLGVIEMNGSVEAPGSTGLAVVCFRSDETFDGSEDGAPAAGTNGAPFLVMN